MKEWFRMKNQDLRGFVIFSFCFGLLCLASGISVMAFPPNGITYGVILCIFGILSCSMALITLIKDRRR